MVQLHLLSEDQVQDKDMFKSPIAFLTLTHKA